MLLNVLRLLRAKHWIKNILVFVPLFFSLNFTFQTFITGIAGLIIFSIASSFVYIINDVNDVERDRKHPTKRYRPIASGYFSVKTASLVAAGLLIFLGVIFLVLKISPGAVLVISSYIILNIGYSLGLKNIPILDIFILATGFVLRVGLGSIILDIEMSNWLLLAVLCGSLFMGIGKRRNELVQQKDSTRLVNKFYNFNFLNNNLYMSMALVICFYSLWSIDVTGNKIQHAIYTVPLVVMILMTYSLKLEDKQCDGDPVNVLMRSKSLLVLSVLYVAFLFLLILL